MKKLLIILLLFTCILSNAQSWCTEKYNPKVTLNGADKSPDFKKTFTLYFYFQHKSNNRTTFFSPIFKLSFINYDNNKNLIGRNFGDRIKKSSIEKIKEKYPNAYIGYSVKSANYCLSLEDLKKEYNKQVKSVKSRGNNVVNIANFVPKSFNYKATGKFAKNQKLTFKLVE